MNRLLISIILLLVVTSPALASLRFGLVSSSGQWLIQPKYWHIQQVDRGLYKATSIEGTKRLFNSKGEELKCPLPVDCQVVEIWISPLSGTEPQIYRLVKSRGRLGVIDRDGTYVIPLDDWSVANFSDGYFLVLKTFADRNTDPTAPGPEFFNVEQRLLVFDVHGKLSSSFSMSNDKYVYLTEPFHDGVLIGWQRSDQQRYVYFDVATGKQLDIPPQPKAEEFKEGSLLVNGPPRSFWTRQGKRLGGRDFDEAVPFVGGFAVIGSAKYGVTKYGTMDRSGKVCIPAIYKRINHPSANEFYVETSKNQWFAVNSFGKITRQFPSRMEPIGIYGDEIDCVIHANPNFSAWDDERGVLNNRGKFTAFNQVDTSSDRPKLIRVDKSDRELSLFGLKNRRGWILEPKFDFLVPSKDGNYIAALQPQAFSSADWQEEAKSARGCDRQALFNLLLQSQDIIGMPESQLVVLLGVERKQADGYRYIFQSGGGCGMGSTDLFIAVENQRVKGWCKCAGMDFGPIRSEKSIYQWYETNVVSNGDVRHGEPPYVAKVNATPKQ